jgi:hypothetical protein
MRDTGTESAGCSACVCCRAGPFVSGCSPPSCGCRRRRLPINRNNSAVRGNVSARRLVVVSSMRPISLFPRRGRSDFPMMQNRTAVTAQSFTLGTNTPSSFRPSGICSGCLRANINLVFRVNRTPAGISGGRRWRRCSPSFNPVVRLGFFKPVGPCARVLLFRFDPAACPGFGAWWTMSVTYYTHEFFSPFTLYALGSARSPGICSGAIARR